MSADTFYVYFYFPSVTEVIWVQKNLVFLFYEIEQILTITRYCYENIYEIQGILII